MLAQSTKAHPRIRLLINREAHISLGTADNDCATEPILSKEEKHVLLYAERQVWKQDEHWEGCRAAGARHTTQLHN